MDIEFNRNEDRSNNNFSTSEKIGKVRLGGGNQELKKNMPKAN